MKNYLRRDLEREASGGRGTFRARLRDRLPSRIRPMLRAVLTLAIRPRELLRARALTRSAIPLYLNLGSGEAPKRGWVNIDMPPSPADLYWDLLAQLPFPTASVKGVFLEHVLEVFDVRTGDRLVREAHRVLTPGGILRIGVIDARRYIESYTRGDSWITEIKPDRPTALIALQEVFYLHGHRAAYDVETLEVLCLSAGFATFRVSRFGESELPVCPDSEHRRENTLYVEAIR